MVFQVQYEAKITTFSFPISRLTMFHWHVLIFRPMICRAENSDMKEFFYNKTCKDRWHRMVEYANQFFKTYQGVAKFAEIWIAKLTHDNINGLYYTDSVRT